MDLNCRKYEMEGEKVVPWNKLELSKYNVQNGLSEDIMVMILKPFKMK